MPLPKEKAKQLISSPYAWMVLGLLTLVYVSSFIDRQIIAVLAIQIQEELQLSNTEVGFLYGTAFSFIYAVFGLPMGRLADMYSRKLMIMAGLVVWSLMTFISGFANSLAFLVTARMFVGISESALSPAVYSLLSDYFEPAKRATVFSIYASGIFIGIAVAFLVGGSVAQAYDWRTSLMSVGLPGLVLAVIIWLVVKELPRGITQDNITYQVDMSVKKVLRYILKKKTLLLHFLGFSFLAITGYTVLGFVGTVLKEIHGAEYLLPNYGWFMLATGGSVIVAGKAADWMAQRWDPSRRFVIGIVAGIASLPFYYFGLFANSGWIALLLIGSANVISSCYNGVAAALLQYLVQPNIRAFTVGLYLFVISIIGFGIGPPLTGWLMDTVFTGSYGPAKALMSVFTISGILASICFLFAMQTYQKDEVIS